MVIFALLLIVFYLVLVLGGILLVVFYLLNMQNLLKQVKPHNQQVEPGNVWLMFIPLFNIVYPFILYPKVCESVKREFEERGIGEDGDYGRSLGITMPILVLCCIIPILGFIAMLGYLVVFIIFWVKLADYKKRLIQNNDSAADLLDTSSKQF